MAVMSLKSLFPLGDGDLANTKVTSDLSLRHRSCQQQAAAFEASLFLLLSTELFGLPCHIPN